MGDTSSQVRSTRIEEASGPLRRLACRRARLSAWRPSPRSWRSRRTQPPRRSTGYIRPSPVLCHHADLAVHGLYHRLAGHAALPGLPIGVRRPPTPAAGRAGHRRRRVRIVPACARSRAVVRRPRAAGPRGRPYHRCGRRCAARRAATRQRGAAVVQRGTDRRQALGAIRRQRAGPVRPGTDPPDLWLLLGVFVASLLAVLTIQEPEPGAPTPWARSAPRVSVPRPARGAFAAALPCLVGLWALGGFYLSLGPSLAAQLAALPQPALGRHLDLPAHRARRSGLRGARKVSPARVMLAGCLALNRGALVTFAAIENQHAVGPVPGHRHRRDSASAPGSSAPTGPRPRSPLSRPVSAPG